MKLLSRRRLHLYEERQGRFYPLFGLVALILLAGFAVWHLALPDAAYSDTEKRALAARPALTVDSLTSGEFMDGMEDYVADQFPLRSSFMKLKTGLTLLFGDRESQGVSYARDGRLIQLFEPYSADQQQKTADAVAAFVQAHEFRHAQFLLVPTAVSLYPELLPPYTETEDELAWREDFLESLPDAMLKPDIPEVFAGMKEAGEEVFYRTDHHWTTDAAFAVFSDAAPAADWTVSSFTSGTVCTDFEGSLVRKSGFTPRRSDAITVYLHDDPNLSCLIIHPSTGTSSGTYYVPSALDGREKYEVFLGGNEPLITIQTTADTNDTLLVFKDSYANCFLPFLFESYKTITVVDPRYYTDSVESLFAQTAYTDVLFLYNVQTLAADESLAIVLEGE